MLGDDLATVVATAVVVGTDRGLEGATFLALAVVVVALAVVVVVGAVVVGSTDVVVSSTTEVDVAASSAVPLALPVRRMAGSLLRWGTPAMATPTAAQTTSISAVTDR